MKKYKERVEADPTFIMYNMAKRRAQVQGIPFDLTREDVQALWPEGGLCPVLGIKLGSNLGKMGSQGQSPTLDKYIPSKGYVRGNVTIVSHKANTIKGDITDPDVFRRLAGWLTNKTDLVGNLSINTRYVQQKLNAAKTRAKKQGVPFDLTVGDVLSIWPSDNKCPVLGVELQVGKGVLGPSACSPSLDKINPQLGYVPGNIAIISCKVNTIKQDDYTPEPFIKMAEWLEKQQGVINGNY
jgi:predicted DNA binding CopG/RHH family protein